MRALVSVSTPEVRAGKGKTHLPSLFNSVFHGTLPLRLHCEAGVDVAEWHH
jgi:hypothetical protein